MNVELQALAREIAQTGTAWIQPGVACVDPETGEQWRPAWSGQRSNPRQRPWLRLEAQWETAISDEGIPLPSLSRAIAAGPDLDDAATLGVLLGLMPEHLIFFHRVGASVGWNCHAPTLGGEWADTRAKAIGLAFKALRKETTP